MNELNQRIAAAGIIPVIKLTRPERDALSLAAALRHGGISAVEITFRSQGADKALHLIANAFPDMLLGAGTIFTTEQADTAYSAGADFIVTPGFDENLIVHCQKHRIPIYPGCSTPTDYQAALKYDIEILKFFPAEQSGGLAKIKALAAPFPMFKIMPTGGISLKNLKEYLSCPVVVACGGSYMATEDMIENKRWDDIAMLCRKSIEIREEARSNG